MSGDRIFISPEGEALIALNQQWAEENKNLIALQKQARQLANAITACQRRQAALQGTMARIIHTHGKPVYSALDLV